LQRRAATAIASLSGAKRVERESVRNDGAPAVAYKVIACDMARILHAWIRGRHVPRRRRASQSVKYNGLKFKAWYGGSGLPEMLLCDCECPRAIIPARRRIDRGIHLLDDYVGALRAQVAVAKSVSHPPRSDPRRFLRSPLANPRQTMLATIRGEINPRRRREPGNRLPRTLGASMAVMNGDYDLAICNDGDADRLGILDEKGAFVSPQKIIALLALYLVREKK